MMRKLSWEIAALSVHLDEVRQFWAQAVNISGPQWTIVMAIAELDPNGEEGVPVTGVSKMLQVDPSFVTTQSKLLEQRGLLRRKPSADDGRVVRMSLTEKARRQLADLSEHQTAISDYVFEEFGERELQELTDNLATLNGRLEKARLKIALDS